MGAGSVAVDGYLAALPDEPRRALEKMRAAIRRIIPQAEEAISYGMPVFRLQGRPIIGYRAAAKHCAVYPFSGQVLSGLANELSGFGVSQGTVRFAPENAPSSRLLRKIIQARIRELDGESPKVAGKRGGKKGRKEIS